MWPLPPGIRGIKEPGSVTAPRIGLGFTLNLPLSTLCFPLLSHLLTRGPEGRILREHATAFPVPNGR